MEDRQDEFMSRINQLQRWMTGFFDKHRGMVAANVGQNRLIEKVK